ncbi:rCG37032 [Rattus norvegicus]|uniref:RCG37032 n=1 Tax=Rattus norvegicus TaxID=10116 RepID=A6HUC8_RAT|nr:rCG37032 [Rattus norvegicus]
MLKIHKMTGTKISTGALLCFLLSCKS